MTVHDLPALNASLNALAGVLLLTGYVLVRSGRVAAHRRVMIAAFSTSSLFLTSYIVYHAQVGSVPFTRQGVVRPLYFAILISHVTLAASVLPLSIVTLSRGLAGRIPRHRSIARWTFPIWLYVSVTGVLVYVLLLPADMAPVIQIYTEPGNALGAPFWRLRIMRLGSLASLVTAVTFFLTLAAPAAPAAAQSTQGRISGIVNDENNKPIKAATVAAENAEINQTFTATTDEKGRFTIIGLRPGTWQFTAAAPGYFADRGTMPIKVGTPNPPIAFALKKTGAPNGGVLGNVQAKDLQQDLLAADLLFNQRKYDEAVTAYRAIMSKAPTLSVINLQIGNAFMNKKDYDSAVAAYNDLLHVDPNNAKGIVGIAKAELARGNIDGAEAALLKAADNPAASSREVFDNLADIKSNKGDTDEAVKWYKRASDADPTWGKPWYRLGLIAQKKGDKGQATQAFTKAISVDPVSPEAAMAKATLDQLNR